MMSVQCRQRLVEIMESDVNVPETFARWEEERTKNRVQLGIRQKTWPVPHGVTMVECIGVTSSAAPVNGGRAKCACLGAKSIGKPCAGKPHARFDEGVQARASSVLYSTLCVLLGFLGSLSPGGWRHED